MAEPEANEQLLRLQQQHGDNEDEEGINNDLSNRTRGDASSPVSDGSIGSAAAGDSSAGSSPKRPETEDGEAMEEDEEEMIQQPYMAKALAAAVRTAYFDDGPRRCSTHRDVSRENGLMVPGIRYELGGSDQSEDEKSPRVARKSSSRASVYPSRISTISREAFGGYIFILM